MKYFVSAVVAALLMGNLTVASASVTPRAIATASPAATVPIVCKGNRRDYRNFNHCMRFNPRGLRYCSRICGSNS